MADVIDALRAVVGAVHVQTGAAIAPQHCTDWFGAHTHVPRALVKPASPAQVAEVMAICHAYNQPVTPQGGLTGLVAGAVPRPDDVALSLSRLNGIEELDMSAGTLTVLAGTPLQTVQQAAREAGLLLAVDFGARGSCQIGGNIATNAGGNRVIRYGMFREQVLGLEVVLADGTVICNLNKMLKSNAGYDLKQLFIGSEGTLGIITRAVLRLHPLPQSCQTAWCCAPSYDHAVRLLHHARQALGSTLSSFEVMWPDFHTMVTTRFAHLRAPLSAAGMQILVEVEGNDAQRDEEVFARMLENALRQGIVSDAALAQSLRERESFWQLRDAVSEFATALHPYCGYDISLAIGAIGLFVQELQSALVHDIPHCGHVHFGHIGDSNLHIGVWLDARWGPFPEKQIDACVYRMVQKYDGCVSAEHGIGLHKRAYLGVSRSAQEIAVMRSLKQALDPKGLLNHGKVFM